MRRFLAGLLALVSVTILIATADRSLAADKRVALVIGNSAYDHVGSSPTRRTTPRAIADDAPQRRLRRRRDASKTSAALRHAPRAPRLLGQDARDADIAVVYYAGHGIEVDGTNYLLPVDAALERDIDVEDEARLARPRRAGSRAGQAAAAGHPRRLPRQPVRRRR